VLIVTRVCIAGITGWVGRPVADAVRATDGLELVAGIARRAAGQRVAGVVVSASIDEALRTDFDVLVEFTGAEAAKMDALAAARAGRHVVIGSSGLSTEDYEEIDAIAQEQHVGVVAVGNFTLSAALLQRFAIEAAKHLPSWEIIDTASAGKPDAPSGTARELAWRMSQVRTPETQIPVSETIGRPDARGADVDGSRVHSLRLPGYTIGLEVRFGLPNERLTIAYDGGPEADPYIAGTLLAIRRVTGLTGLVRGLDQLL
jgi:4-hydroxy-tetrahydrodipicolinate reductase